MSSSITNWLASLAAQHANIAKTGVLVSTNTFQSSQQYPSPVLEIRRPWIDPPEGFVPYDAQMGVTLPAVGAASTTFLSPATGAALVGSFTVDIGFDGVINYISCNFAGPNFQDFSGNIIWILFRNTQPVRNFNNIQAQKGTIQQPRKIAPIRIFSGDVISWVVIHASNGSLNGPVVCTLTGYTYPNRG